MAPRYPSIPTSTTDVESLRKAASETKETLEIMTGVRGNRLDSVVTWNDLINLGIIVPAQVPK